MKFDLKPIAAGAVFALASSAHALVITQGNLSCCSLNLSPLEGIGLSFSADMLASFDMAKVSITGSGASSIAAPKDTDGYYVGVSVSTPITSATFDDATSALLQMTSTGGATYVMPAIKSVTSGGSLTVTDLSVDLASHHIYANIVGANGLGTLTHLQLLNFADVSVSGATGAIAQPCIGALDGFCSVPRISLSGLSWTVEGFNAFTKGLGLAYLNRSYLDITQDVGTLTTTSLPEPSSYALMGLGLVGILAAQRRRHPIAAQ